jgi:transketolase
MRNAFVETLFDLAVRDARIVLITGDLGFGVVTRFMEQLPRQFVNAGVAEQNMTGLAAGMALSGKIVFTYSIANFPTLRCLEQIRNDLCYHRANVTVVSVGGGFAYGAMGSTHHATEDLGIMRTLPEMVVVAPADPVETRHATRAIVDHLGPCYLRLGKAGERVVHQGSIAFELGRAIQVRDGRDVTLISTGALLHTALRAADHLAAEGREARVLSMHTIKPLDEDAVLKAAQETQAIATLEEHSIIGGLGSAVAEVLAEAGAGSPFKRLGLPSSFSPHIGGQEFLLERHGLTVGAIVPVIRQLLERPKLLAGSAHW